MLTGTGTAVHCGTAKSSRWRHSWRQVLFNNDETGNATWKLFDIAFLNQLRKYCSEKQMHLRCKIMIDLFSLSYYLYAGGGAPFVVTDNQIDILLFSPRGIHNQRTFLLYFGSHNRKYYSNHTEWEVRLLQWGNCFCSTVRWRMFLHSDDSIRLLSCIFSYSMTRQYC